MSYLVLTHSYVVLGFSMVTMATPPLHTMYESSSSNSGRRDEEEEKVLLY